MDKGKLLTKVVVASMFVALGIVLPFITLNNQQLGSMFALMHIPVFLAGLILGWQYGLVVGLITPILRHFMVTMPPLPIALSMMFELATYGVVVALVRKLLPNKNYMIEVALIVAMLAGRVVWGAAASIIYKAFDFNFSFTIFLTSGFVTALPGIITHLLLVPNIYYRLSKTGVLNKVGLEDNLDEEAWE